MSVIGYSEGIKKTWGSNVCAECVIWSGPHGVGFFSVGSLAFIGGWLHFAISGFARLCVLGLCGQGAGTNRSTGIGTLSSIGPVFLFLAYRDGGLHSIEEGNPKQHFISFRQSSPWRVGWSSGLVA